MPVGMLHYDASGIHTVVCFDHIVPGVLVRLGGSMD
jgi:hypothetical protein